MRRFFKPKRFSFPLIVSDGRPFCGHGRRIIYCSILGWRTESQLDFRGLRPFGRATGPFQHIDLTNLIGLLLGRSCQSLLRVGRGPEVPVPVEDRSPSTALVLPLDESPEGLRHNRLARSMRHRVLCTLGPSPGPVGRLPSSAEWPPFRRPTCNLHCPTRSVQARSMDLMQLPS